MLMMMAARRGCKQSPFLSQHGLRLGKFLGFAEVHKVSPMFHPEKEERVTWPCFNMNLGRPAQHE